VKTGFVAVFTEVQIVQIINLACSCAFGSTNVRARVCACVCAANTQKVNAKGFERHKLLAHANRKIWERYDRRT